MKKVIGVVVLAGAAYLIFSGTAAAFWSGFWPALHNGAQFHAGTSFGKHYTAAQQKTDVIEFGIVLVVVFTIRWILIRALGDRARHPR